MAITPRSKGLGDIGAIVDRQGRASPTSKAPVKPTSVSKPKIAAPVKPAPRPAAKPVAKVAPKPAPKMAPAPKPSPFSKKPDTRAPGGGGMDFNGNPIGGGMGAQMNIARPGQGNLARNTGPGNGGPQLIGGAYGKPIFGGAPKPQPIIDPMPDPFDPFSFKPPQYNPSMGGTKEMYDQYQNIRNRMTADVRPEDRMDFNQFVAYRNGTYTPPPDDDRMPDLPTNTGTGPGTPYDPFQEFLGKRDYRNPEFRGQEGMLDIPQTAPDFTNYDNRMPDLPTDTFAYPTEQYMPPEPPPGYDYGGPYTPRPDLGPGVGFGVGLPQPGQNTGMFGEPIGIDQFNPGFGGNITDPNMNDFSRGEYYNQYGIPGAPGQGGEPAPYNGGMMSPKRVINQVGKPGFQPRTNMSNAFSPDNNNFGGGGFMGGGTGSMFGGGGFAGK
jgi:hypothetical protein